MTAGGGDPKAQPVSGSLVALRTIRPGRPELFAAALRALALDLICEPRAVALGFGGDARQGSV